MWFIHFSVFRVHEYCFHTYISTIVVQSRFWFYSQLIIHWFLLSIQFCTSNSHRHLLANKKLTQKVLGSLITSIFFSIINFFSIIIMTRLNCCKLFQWFYYADTKDSICLVSFFNLYELLSAFIYSNNTGSLNNILFGVEVCNPFLSFSSSSPSSGGMSGHSIDSSLSLFFEVVSVDC